MKMSNLTEWGLISKFKGESPHLIDEWQEFPELWDATRAYVDTSPEKGKYLLTGSSTPNRKGVRLFASSSRKSAISAILRLPVRF